MKTHLKLFLLLGTLFSALQLNSQTMYKIKASDENIVYTGRIDYSNPEKLGFSFPGTNIKAKFTGSSINILLKENGYGQ